MMTIALSTVLEGIVTLLGGDTRRTINFADHHDESRQISVPSESLIGLMVSVVAVVMLIFLFQYTKIGSECGHCRGFKSCPKPWHPGHHRLFRSWVIAAVVE